MFAVFGVTDTVCEARAAKLVADGRKYRSKRLDEDDEPIIYRGGVEIASAMFEEMKPIKLSPVYSNRKEAEQYKQLAERSVKARALSIKKRVHPLDDNGYPVVDPKTKKPKYTWEPA